MRWPLRALAILLAAFVALPAVARAADAVPPKAAELLRLLEDPDIHRWLEQQRTSKAEAPEPSGAADTPTFFALMDTRVAIIRAHMASIAAALPTLPQELWRVARVPFADSTAAEFALVLLSIAAVVAIGVGVEWLFERTVASERDRIASLRVESVGDRLRGIALRAAFLIGPVVAFAVGVAAAFLIFGWPPVIREIVLVYLVAAIGLRVALAVIHLLFAPEADGKRLRVIPMSDPGARFWATWLGAFAAWFAIGYTTVSLLAAFGLQPDHRRLFGYMLGLGLLAIALVIAWRHRRAAATDAVAQSARSGATPWLLTAYFAVVWVSWVTFALNLFWFALIGGALLLLTRTSNRAVLHVLRPPSVAAGAPWQPSIRVICIERGLRLALLLGAIFMLVTKWQLDFAALSASDTLHIRLLRGALGAIVVTLLASFAWTILNAAIERKLTETSTLGAPGSEEARRRARVRTLLPMLRTVAMIVLITVATMMALASLGIEIGPLIAGAGVIGLAVGFGAQTLVRDVISGMFYLLDDAFRVGEYIESGNYKGTVESFSLRTVKLRHHRGPLYTVPFGVLGAVKNMSRDWVVDKLTVSVDYDTDLDKVKKLIKQMGRSLAENEELKPIILGPLKLQGIEEFTDYGIKLRMKMTTRPGEQFVVRRMAYSLIKKIFEENGIRFASPTVQVSGEGSTASAAAAGRALQSLELASDRR